MAISDIISGVGVFFILLAFLGNTFNYLSDKSRLYFFLNMIGGVLACTGSILIPSVPFAILEGIWSIVACIGLIKVWNLHEAHDTE